MHFKKLELFGFKSFAEKTVLNFEPGVTAVVGPNGCGKSNIADAIRWVLGEQSPRSLRGSHMEDVIFNGTDERKSLSMAEVSLTLSGCSPVLPVEYDEVTVARRLFRSGESQYFLNKNQVRLKDITELFMGTGVGTEAYSLIEQGKIDLILSSKPEDRRFVFEEAAGITKYKSRKKEALRKLEQTEVNLVRANDIINEVKRQINSIDRQAKKAQRYQEQFEQLKTLELKLSWLEDRRIKGQIDAEDKDINSLRQKESEQIALAAHSGEDTGQLRAQLEKIENESGAIRDRQVDIEKEIDRLSSRISLDTERMDELAHRRQTVAAEIEGLNKKIDESAEKIEELRLNISELEAVLGQKREGLAFRQRRLEELIEKIKQGGQQLEKTKIEVIDIAQSQTHFKNDLIKVSANMSNFNARLRRLKAEEAETREELNRIADKLHASSAELKAASEAVEEALRSQQNLETEFKLKDQERLKLTERLNTRKERLTAAVSKLDFLEELRRKYEGFAPGAKELIGLKNSQDAVYQCIHGLVYDFIQVEPGYEAALESAFGDWLQAVIVNNQDDIKLFSAYLDEHNLGRVWFLPMDVVSSSHNVLADSGPQIEGLIGRATDFLKVQPQYTELIRWLLKDTYLAENIEQALSLVSSAPGHDKYRFITLNGQMVYRGGLVWAGRRKSREDEGLIVRQALIRDLGQEVEKLKQETSAQKIELKGLEDEIEAINQHLNLVRQDLDEKRLQASDKQTAHTRLESEHKKIEDELGLVHLELNEVEEEIAQAREREQHLQEELQKIELNHNNIQTFITTTQNDLNRMAAEREELLEETGEMRAEVSSSEEKLNSHLSSRDIYQRTLNDYRQSVAIRSDQLKEFESNQQRLREEIVQAKEKLIELDQQKTRVAKQIEGILGRRAEINNQLKRQEELRGQQQGKIEELHQQLHQRQEKKTEFSFQAQRLRERMQETYKVDIEQAPIDIEDGFGQDQARAEAEELKEKLDRFGPVSLGAIEEHQELTERHEFLTGQQQDLIQAKESLHKVITKINRTTRKLFMETFSQIQITFREFFRLLFGGGDADLILIDQEDILESGIEIMARPPGKKLQAISLLSGGEKALAAIALIFAIFRVKPSPFCVLDEIDAPLDEANIDRFSRVLAEFVKTSQFIIITHNKKTIGMADVMYGVTMEESGISKIVSVKFRKEEESPQAEYEQLSEKGKQISGEGAEENTAKHRRSTAEALQSRIGENTLES